MKPGKLHGNADALSRLLQNVGESDIRSVSDAVVSVIATTTLLPAYSRVTVVRLINKIMSITFHKKYFKIISHILRFLWI